MKESPAKDCIRSQQIETEDKIKNKFLESQFGLLVIAIGVFMAKVMLCSVVLTLITIMTMACALASFSRQVWIFLQSTYSR